MGISSACLTAVAAGAVTASVATGVTAMPQPQETEPSTARAMNLTATDRPIVDIDRTVGPLTVIRRLVASYDSAPQFLTGLFGVSTTEWNGSLAHGVADIRWQERLFVDTTDGLNSGGTFILPRGSVQGGLGRDVGNGGVGVEGSIAGALPDFRPNLVAKQGGATYFSGFAPVNTSAGGQIGLGPISVTSAASGSVSNTTRVCLGSAPLSCGPGVIAQTSTSVPLNTNFAIARPGGDVNVLAVDIPNNVAVTVWSHQLAVTGAVGGTVKVGPVTLGRIVPRTSRFRARPLPHRRERLTPAMEPGQTPANSVLRSAIASTTSGTPSRRRWHRSVKRRRSPRTRRIVH